MHSYTALLMVVSARRQRPRRVLIAYAAPGLPASPRHTGEVFPVALSPANSPWSMPAFRLLWAGRSVSVFGSLIGGLALQFTAILWLEASPGEVAILAASQLLAGFLASAGAGVWVDRLRRRPLMIAADLGRAAILFSIPAAALAGWLTMAQLYVAGFAASALTAFFEAAYQAYLPTLIPRTELVEGNARLQGTASAVEVASFSASGWLVQALRAPGAVAIDALTFVASAFFLWRIEADEPPPPPAAERAGFLGEAIDGLRVVAGHPLLRPLAIATALQSLAAQIISVLFLVYLSGEIGFAPGTLGLIFAVGGISSVAGAWVANRGWLVAGSAGPTLIAAAALRAVGAFFMPLCASTGPAGVALLVANQLVTDPFWTIFEIHDVSLRQAAAPEQMLGRVFANFRLVEFGFAFAGTGAAAVLAALVGTRGGLFAGCGLMLLSAAVLAASPAVRDARKALQRA